MVETHAGSQRGLLGQLDVVLDVQRIALGVDLRGGTIEALEAGAAVARIEALRAARTLVVEGFVEVFATHGEHLFQAAEAQRQADFAAGAGVAQPRDGRPGTIGDGPFRPAGEAFVEAPVARVVVGQRGLGRAPVEFAQVGQIEVVALYDVGFGAIQTLDEGDVATAVAVHRVAGIDVALAAVAGGQLEGVRIVQAPAQQAVDVLVAYPFATGRKRAVLRVGVDVDVVGVGLVQAAVDAERQGVGQRAAEAEVGALADTLGLVLGHHRVQVEAAAERVGRALGDDVDHPAHGAGTVARRSRATEDLDALDFLGRHPVGLAAGVAVAVPAVAHGVARGGRLAVDEDQGVLRAHPAQVDLAVVAACAAGTVAGQVDARLAADDVRQVVARRTLPDVFRGDDGHARRLLQLFLGGAHHVRALQFQRIVRSGLRRFALQRRGAFLVARFLGFLGLQGPRCIGQHDGGSQMAETELRVHVSLLSM